MRVFYGAGCFSLKFEFGDFTGGGRSEKDEAKRNIDRQIEGSALRLVLETRELRELKCHTYLIKRDRDKGFYVKRCTMYRHVYKQGFEG